MFENILESLYKRTPLVHCITNYVTVNDVANMLLACGASPIMADDEGEVEEITSLCGGLVINIGTLNSRTIVSMRKAGKRANALGHPVVLDPVGAGASTLRTETALSLMEDIHFTVLRGNISEIKTAAQGRGATQGVDANPGDAVTENNLDESVRFVKALSKKTGAIIAVTGAIDLVSSASEAYIIRNGHPMMSRITGTGCMLSALTAAYCTANPEAPLEAAAAAVSAMGLCGELAFHEVGNRGTGSLRTAILDVMSRLDARTLAEGAKVERR